MLDGLHLPLDEHDRILVQRVRPTDWVNPSPKTRYHLVVIGGGTAGLVSAAGAASLGASVALVERRLMGGDCLNFGCVPSKALLRAARAVADVRRAAEFGVHGGGPIGVDFPAVMARMRRLRAGISPNDSVQRFRDLGVDVFLGSAQFVAEDRVVVEGRELSFHRAILATGTSPSIPPIPGLAEATFLTNETIFSLTQLPRRLAILGTGPIGCELAQAFARFGTRVTLLGSRDQVLPRESADASALVAQALWDDGVELLLGAKYERVEQHGGETELFIETQGQTRTIATDALLVAAGRTPNVAGLGLDAAKVEWDAATGVTVNDRLQTTNRRIFAAGDVCSRFKFTHAADAMARIAIQNALFFGRAKASRLVIPWCTYTDPELAHVGLHETEAAAQGIAIDTFTQEFTHVDRAVLDGEAVGFVRIHVRKGTDTIVGATIVSRHAGEMISEVALAMTAGQGIAMLGRTIHPYPTHGEALRKIGDAYNRTRLTPTVRWLFRKWFSWIGR